MTPNHDAEVFEKLYSHFHPSYRLTKDENGYICEQAERAWKAWKADPTLIESLKPQGEVAGDRKAAVDALNRHIQILNYLELEIFRSGTQGRDDIKTIRAALLAPAVKEVTVEELSGDMVNALYDYKILGGRFGDTAARIIISKLHSKFPNGLKIISGEGA